MGKTREKVRLLFYWLGGFVHEHPVKILIIVSFLLVSLFTQLPKITVDISTEGFFHENDPSLIEYNKFRDEFGRDEMIVLAVYTENVFDMEFLGKLKKIHREIEENVPYLDEVTSLVNIRNTRGEDDELIVEDFLEVWPENDEDLIKLKNLALENEMYENFIISGDGKITTIAIETQTYSSKFIGDTKKKAGDVIIDVSDFEDGFGEDNLDEKIYLTDEENSEAVEAVKKIVDKYNGENFQIRLTGSAAVTHFIKKTMAEDLGRFIVLAIIVISIILFFMFRRISGIILPLLVTILSLLATISLMALSGKSIKLPTQILPSFILAVSVGFSVHILALYYKKISQNNDKKEAVIYSVGHSGLAIVLTAVTTAGGLLSFSTAEVAPVADLGIFAGMGVMIAMLITFLVLPAFLAILPGGTLKKEKPGGRGELFDNFLVETGKFSMGNSKKILFITILVLACSIYGALGMRFSHAPLEWLPVDNSIRVATEMVDEDLRGSVTLEAVIDTGEDSGLYDPDFMKRLEDSGNYMESFEAKDVFVGKVTSLGDILKETNQALNENRTEFYTIPDNKELIAQELLLFENSGSDDLLDFSDTQFKKARLIIKAPFKDALLYEPLLNRIRSHLQEKYPDSEIVLTGMMALFFETLSNAVKTMAKSYSYALFTITILMILLIGSLKAGLLSMVPNLTSVVITLGIIGWFQIPMSLFTMLVGNIAIGLAVDDTIHFMHNFKVYFDKSGKVETAVKETFLTAGRAMLVTSLVLSAGFFIFMFAGMNNLYDFGLLTGITILTALLANFLVTPALLSFAYENKV